MERTEADYDHFQQELPVQLSVLERKQIQDLADDLPALWKSTTTTDEDRKLILRQLIDHVVVSVDGNTEWVVLRIHWVGGHETYRRVRRPVGGTAQLSNWPDLLERLKQLKAERLSAPQIAERLHHDGFKAAKGGQITATVVRTWLSRHGISTKHQTIPFELKENEWTIPELVDRYSLPNGTIYTWIRNGRLLARQHGSSGGRWLVQATEEQLRHLVNNRRKPSGATDENSAAIIPKRHETVTRGAV